MQDIDKCHEDILIRIWAAFTGVSIYNFADMLSEEEFETEGHVYMREDDEPRYHEWQEARGLVTPHAIAHYLAAYQFLPAWECDECPPDEPF